MENASLAALEPRCPQGFGPHNRLRRRREFDQVFAFGRSAADRHFVVYTRDTESETSRLGLVVGRKAGNAVRRHRIKRLLREAFRLSRNRFAGGVEVVVVVRTNAWPDTLADVRNALVRLVGKSLKATPRPRPPRRRR
jgi:ribonuclease P protein component